MHNDDALRLLGRRDSTSQAVTACAILCVCHIFSCSYYRSLLSLYFDSALLGRCITEDLWLVTLMYVGCPLSPPSPFLTTMSRPCLCVMHLEAHT